MGVAVEAELTGYTFGKRFVDGCVVGRKMTDDVSALVGGCNGCEFIGIGGKQIVEFGYESLYRGMNSMRPSGISTVP